MNATIRKAELKDDEKIARAEQERLEKGRYFDSLSFSLHLVKMLIDINLL